MIVNYLKIALRNIIKHKGISFLNILGLAIGLACSVFIFLFVMYELSYDKFHEKADRIYRLAIRASIGDTKINQTYSSAINFTRLFEDYPELEVGVKFLNFGRVPVILGEKTWYEEGFFGVDSTFFSVFTFPLIEGDPENVLNRPNTMVLTESIALKYFGNTDVVGQILKVDYSQYGGIVDFEVTGVCENVPGNSHFHYNILVSNVSFPDYINNTGWTSNNFITYLVMKEGTSKEEFDQKLKEFARKYMGGDEFDNWVAQGNYWEYFLQPLTGIHLNSDLNGEFEANGNKNYVYIFFVISVFILLIACINFMNLSTAKASVRAREIGIRKVVGSPKIGLIRQFLSESVVLSIISLAFALLIVELLMPLYRNLVGRQLDIHYFDNPVVIPLLLALALVVGIISGSYPAFFLSSFKPVTVLKGSNEERKGGSRLRNILVIFQFAISVFLIIGTLMVFKQLKLLQDKDLGFDKEQVLVIHNPGALGTNTTTLKETLRNYHNIVNVSGSNTLPGRGFANWGFGAEGVEESFTLNACICDYDFLKTLGIDLKQGRFFSRDFPSDSCAAVLNEKAAELLGWDDPIGKKINNWATNRGNFNVIGVIKDYHYESLHQEIRPMALFLIGGYFQRIQSYISVRMNTENIPETLKFVEKTWNQFAQNKPFEYSFLEEDYDNLYMNEMQTRKLFGLFSILAVFIACLGLSGLASFVADRKTKEIGIRKVFGASIPRIIGILNRAFIIWILIANLIAWPAAWYVMKKWLENFAYRVDVLRLWWVFILAALLALIISVLVVSFQSVKAAIKNPADTLRYE